MRLVMPPGDSISVRARTVGVSRWGGPARPQGGQHVELPELEPVAGEDGVERSGGVGVEATESPEGGHGLEVEVGAFGPPLLDHGVHGVGAGFGHAATIVRMAR